MSNVIELPDDDLSAIECVISYFYSEKYSTEGKLPREILLMHIKAYAIADKYDVMALWEYSFECFTELLDEAHRSKNAEMVTTLLTVVPEIYSSTPDTKRHLRQAAVEFIRNSKSYLTKDDDEMAKSCWELISSVPSFSADLAKDFMTTPARVWCSNCDSHTTCQVMEVKCSFCSEWLKTESIRAAF